MPPASPSIRSRRAIRALNRDHERDALQTYLHLRGYTDKSPDVSPSERNPASIKRLAQIPDWQAAARERQKNIQAALLPDWRTMRRVQQMKEEMDARPTYFIDEADERQTAGERMELMRSRSCKRLERLNDKGVFNRAANQIRADAHLACAYHKMQKEDRAENLKRQAHTAGGTRMTDRQRMIIEAGVRGKQQGSRETTPKLRSRAPAGPLKLPPIEMPGQTNRETAAMMARQQGRATDGGPLTRAKAGELVPRRRGFTMTLDERRLTMPT